MTRRMLRQTLAAWTVLALAACAQPLLEPGEFLNAKPNGGGGFGAGGGNGGDGGSDGGSGVKRQDLVAAVDRGADEGVVWGEPLGRRPVRPRHRCLLTDPLGFPCSRCGESASPASQGS